MRLFAVCTHVEGWYDALVGSAVRGGYNLTTIGWQEKWGGFVWRMSLMLDALKNLDREEIICFVDAYDVIMLVPAIELRQRYDALVLDGRVLLGVENPMKEPFMRAIKKGVFGTCVNGYTVNAGAYMGSVATVHTFIVHILNRAKETNEPNDQKVLNGGLCQMLVEKKLIAIDERGDVFFHAVCATNVWSGLVRGECLFGLGVDLENPLTGRRPAILHAPGGLNLDRVCQRLDLPKGRVRNRWRWIIDNYKIEFGICVLLFVVIVIIGSCFWKRKRTSNE
jgi:hypothetical protein